MSSDDDGPGDDTEREAEHDSSTTATTGSTVANTVQTAGEQRRRGGAGETVGRTFDSARETLAQPGPKSQLTLVIGLFAVIGVGFGLTGIVAVEFVAGSTTGGQFVGALLLISLFAVLLFTGPIAGAFSGLRVADRLNENAGTVYLTSFVATAVGYFVMVVVSVLLLGLVVGGGDATTGGGSLFDLLDLVIPLVLLAIPVGITGLGSSFLTLRTTDR